MLQLENTERNPIPIMSLLRNETFVVIHLLDLLVIE